MAKREIRESKIEKYFRTETERNGFLCFKFISPGNNGVPDRVLIGYGKTVFVELKAPGETPRELQHHMHSLMKRHGAKVYVVDTMDDVQDLLFELMPTAKYKKLNPNSKHIVSDNTATKETNHDKKQKVDSKDQRKPLRSKRPEKHVSISKAFRTTLSDTCSKASKADSIDCIGSSPFINLDSSLLTESDIRVSDRIRDYADKSEKSGKSGNRRSGRRNKTDTADAKS